MRKRMKWLDDERYIRFAGAMLLISPFFNFFLSVAANNTIPDKWAPYQLWAVFTAATTLQWIMRGLKMVVGFLMFRGKSSAWIPVLAILGVTIVSNFLTFKKDMEISKVQTVLSIVINIILFLIVFRAEFRLNQEFERKLAAARAAKAATSAKPRAVTATSVVRAAPSTQKKIKTVDFVIPRGSLIDFKGHGHFAKVIRCQGDELWLQSTQDLPKDIQKRSVILDSADRKHSVLLKFNRTQDDQYLVFKMVGWS